MIIVLLANTMLIQIHSIFFTLILPKEAKPLVANVKYCVLLELMEIQRVKQVFVNVYIIILKQIEI